MHVENFFYVNLYEKYNYVHHCLFGYWNEFPNCQREDLVSHSNDEYNAALELDRSSHPVTAPCCFSHSLTLK